MLFIFFIFSFLMSNSSFCSQTEIALSNQDIIHEICEHVDVKYLNNVCTVNKFFYYSLVQYYCKKYADPFIENVSLISSDKLYGYDGQALLHKGFKTSIFNEVGFRRVNISYSDALSDQNYYCRNKIFVYSEDFFGHAELNNFLGGGKKIISYVIEATNPRTKQNVDTEKIVNIFLEHKIPLSQINLSNQKHIVSCIKTDPVLEKIINTGSKKLLEFDHCGKNPLHYLAEKKNISKQLLDSYVIFFKNHFSDKQFLEFINSRCKHNTIPLYIAFERINKNMVEFLFNYLSENQIDQFLDSKGMSFLHGYLKKYYEIFQNKAKAGIVADVEYLKNLLLQSNLNLNLIHNKKSLFDIAIEANDYALFDFLIENDNVDINILNGAGENPVFPAIRNNKTVFLKKLIDKRINVNCVNTAGEHPLLIAFKLQDGVMFNLLYRGSDVDINVKIDKRGSSLLHYLVKNNVNIDVNAFFFLKQKGINVNLRDNLGKSALDYALDYVLNRNNDEWAIFLIAHGADLNVTYENQPLVCWVINHRKYDLSQLMLQQENVNINVFDAQGRSPLLLALDRNLINIFGLLLQKGADPNVTYNNKSIFYDAMYYSKLNFAKLLLQQESIDVNSLNDCLSCVYERYKDCSKESLINGYKLCLEHNIPIKKNKIPFFVDYFIKQIAKRAIDPIKYQKIDQMNFFRDIIFLSALWSGGTNFEALAFIGGLSWLQLKIIKKLYLDRKNIKTIEDINILLDKYVIKFFYWGAFFALNGITIFALLRRLYTLFIDKTLTDKILNDYEEVDSKGSLLLISSFLFSALECCFLDKLM